MKIARILLTVAIVGLVAMVAVADDKDPTPPNGVGVRGTGNGPVATRGTLTVIYDDGSAESNVGTLGLQAGNKFVSSGAAWSTFFIDQVSVYWDVMSGSQAWLTCYKSLNTAGTDLNSYTTSNFVVGSSTGWKFIDGSTTPIDWVGNAASTFVDTAWISADDIGDFAGLDTNTTAGHGFTITSYTGSGYTEDSSFNAMIRPRLNGDSVPVELQSFSIN